jgi:hypothetical protein
MYKNNVILLIEEGMQSRMDKDTNLLTFDSTEPSVVAAAALQ